MEGFERLTVCVFMLKYSMNRRIVDMQKIFKTLAVAGMIAFSSTAVADAPSKNEWKKKFPGIEYPKDDCLNCTRSHAEWAYGWYRKHSIMDRDHKNNGGLKSWKFSKGKEVRVINEDIKPLDSKVFDFVYNRDISSLMVMENGVLIHDWKRNYVKDSVPIAGNSRSKSVLGVAIATAVCRNGLDLNKTHGYYSKEIAGSYYEDITLLQSLNMMARDKDIIGYELKSIHNKKIDIITQVNRFKKELEYPSENKWHYSNQNTDLVLLALVNHLGGKKKFIKWFNKNVANEAGFADKSKLLLDKKGTGMASNNFKFTRDDWMRFGMYVIELMKDPASCEGQLLHNAFDNAVETGKKFGPKYAMFFWLNGYGVDNLVQMRGHGLRLTLIDWKNNRIIQTNGFAISWKPQELVNLLWK